MFFHFRNLFVLLVFACFLASCEAPPPQQSQQPAANVNSNAPANSNAVAANPTPSPVENKNATTNSPVTLAVLDAMFAEENFAAELKSKVGLTDEQIEKLKTAAREATANLDESENGSTNAETKRAEEQIRGIIGDEKARALTQFVSERWAKGEGNEQQKAASSNKPNAVPNDTRIVVNAPAYRMDVFKEGQLVKTYKIGIGYPEFPLPTGMRKAETIIFNPTWTPPDEPWVKGKLEPGKKVEAGSKLNPLGPIKIPIGLPSLIHGGKAAAKLGGFASHGCVGLTDAQVKDFAVQLAQTGGTKLTAADVTNYGKNKTETKNVKLAQSVPVELRYETIVIEDGKLKIYRDVYEHGTNTEENLRKVLEAHGVSFDSLSEQERAKILEALKQMARDPQGNPVEVVKANSNKKNTSDKETKTIKGAKEISIDIAALKGKGYPAPVNLSKG